MIVIDMIQMMGLQATKHAFNSVLLTALIITLPGLSQANGIYRWVDANGMVHFSDQPVTESRLVDQRHWHASPDEGEAKRVQDRYAALQQHLKKLDKSRQEKLDQTGLGTQSSEPAFKQQVVVQPTIPPIVTVPRNTFWPYNAYPYSYPSYPPAYPPQTYRSGGLSAQFHKQNGNNFFNFRLNYPFYRYW